MKAVLLSGNANSALTDAIGAALGIVPGRRTIDRFPDGECHVVVHEPVRDADVFVVQPLSPPSDAHLVELLFLADACRRAGAARITGVVPYLAWARQDRRRSDAEPHAARLAADLLSSRLDRVVAVDVHGAGVEGFFSVPFDHLSAVPAIAHALSALPADAVVVAPDLGAAKRAEAYGRCLGLPTAIVHKSRVSAREVRAQRVTGDVAGRLPVVVDDMITTGATIEAAVSTLLDAGCRPGAIVATTHPLLVGDAGVRLASLGLDRLLVTDSIPARHFPRLEIEVIPLAPLLSEAIGRLHGGRPLAELLVIA